MSLFKPGALVALIALPFLMPCGHAETPASGKVEEWTVVDAISWRDDSGTHIVVSDTPYDRAEIASDREMNSTDVLHHLGQTLELRVDEKGTLAGINISVPGGITSLSNDDMNEGMNLSRNDGDSVAGSFRYETIAVQFDVPVVSGEMPLPGKPLPVGGGEPEEMFTEMIAAIAKGDFDALVKASPPERRASLLAKAKAKADGGKSKVQEAQQFLPSKVTITGGNIDGDKAWLDFDGVLGGEAIKRVAEVERADGAWYVHNIRPQ